jgi:hypothetical protein
VRRLVVAVLLAGGCDKLLGLQIVPNVSPPDAPPDAAPDAPDAPPCTNGPNPDSFDIAPPCSGLGFADYDGSTTVADEGGRMVIRPGALNATTRGGCIGSPIAFMNPLGAFMQVSSTHGPGEYMFWSLDWKGSSEVSTIGWDPSGIIYQHGGPNAPSPPILGHIPFDPSKTSWVRIRPSDDGTAVIAEFSGDGYAWTAFAWDPMPPPMQVAPLFYGGTFAQEAQPQPIYFDGFDTCP